MDTLSESISIFIRKNSLAGIIFPSQIHPHSEEFSSRDYFPRVNSSLFGRSFLQGLFFRDKFIPIQRNLPAGIIFPSRIHPYSKEFASRDYFLGAKSSLLRRICLQGLFFRAEIIPIQRNPSAGIIFSSRKHPHAKKPVDRDYFPEPNSSPHKRIRLQGCFGNIEGLRQIPESNFRMHGDWQPHPDSRVSSR